MINVKRLYIKRRPFSLIEIIVGVALMGLVVSFLFRFLTHVTRIDHALERIERETQEVSHAASHLSQIFQRLCPDHPTCVTRMFEDEEDLSLMVVFEHGIDPDPTWSGRMMGRLHRTRAHELMLTYWPEGNRNLMRQEILLSNVSHLEWSFWNGGNPIWISEWNRRDLPLTVRLVIDRTHGEPLRFAFFLPQPLEL